METAASMSPTSASPPWSSTPNTGNELVAARETKTFRTTLTLYEQVDLSTNTTMAEVMVFFSGQDYIVWYSTGAPTFSK